MFEKSQQHHWLEKDRLIDDSILAMKGHRSQSTQI